MPLLITPAAPIKTTCDLEVAQVYAIVNEFTYQRLTRLASFELGYYAHEAASLPGSDVAQLAIRLPTGFAFQLPPASIGALGDPTAVLEAYAHHELSGLLGPDATIENVP